jgi:hypothetical protein
MVAARTVLVGEADLRGEPREGKVAELTWPRAGQSQPQTREDGRQGPRDPPRASSASRVRPDSASRSAGGMHSPAPSRASRHCSGLAATRVASSRSEECGETSSRLSRLACEATSCRTRSPPRAGSDREPSARAAACGSPRHAGCRRARVGSASSPFGTHAGPGPARHVLVPECRVVAFLPPAGLLKTMADFHPTAIERSPRSAALSRIRRSGSLRNSRNLVSADAV